MTSSRWKLDSGCPARNWRATTTASAAAGSGPGRRRRRSVASRSHGRSAQTPVCGHETQTTKNRLKAKTTPASRAPAKRCPSARASRNVPRAAAKTFRTATTPSDHAEGQDVGGQAERRQQRRLAVAHERPARPEVRVPERDVGQPGAGVLQPRLELQDGVDQLEVRPEGPDVRRARARPRGGRPEVVRRRQRVPGHQRGRVERHREQAVDQGGRERRPGPQPVQGRPRPRSHGRGAQRARASGCARCHSTVRRSPSSSPTCGAQPVSSRSFVVST